MINQRQIQILELLENCYPNAKIALNYTNAWELLVSVILSAQCTDKIVNGVTENLFKKYHTVDDYANVNLGAFETDIRSTGFYRNKAKNIIATAQIIINRYHKQVPRTMTELLTLKGVARKTANVILGNIYGEIVGIAVDTHVLRISQRLRLVDLNKIGGKIRVNCLAQGKPIIDYLKDADPVKVEQELAKTLPKAKWFKFTYQVIDHGRAICKALNPKCNICPIKDFCPVTRG
jgi:endonuclease III